MTEPVNDDKEVEYMASILTAKRWQEQEAQAMADAVKYLHQAAAGEVPHA